MFKNIQKNNYFYFVLFFKLFYKHFNQKKFII